MPMRALAVAALLLVPATQAAWLEDALGDVQVVADGVPAGLPASPAYASMDLLGLDIVEEADAFTFRLQVDDLAQADDKAPDGEICDVFLAHNDREFRLHVTRLTPALIGGRATLLAREAGGAWDTHSEADLQATFDLATDTITLRLARADLVDASGAAPFPGRVLDDVHALCRNHASGVSVVGGVTPTSPLIVRDDLPDAGMEPGAWPVTIGAAQTGHALLTSPQPFRSSNGEATTFRYNVTAHNLGAARDEFVLVARDVPSNVNITLASDRIILEGGAQEAFPVWVSVPFAHEHGSTTSFILELASVSDAGSVGRLEMGARYLAVPQPSGHHDTLYLHTYPQDGVTDTAVATLPGLYGNDGYLNTLQEDPGDSRDPLTFSSASNGVAEDTGTWELALNPGLRMGLDVDLSRLGQLSVSFGSRTPMELTVSAEVYVYGAGDPVVVARMAPTVTTVSGEVSSVIGELVPDPAADVVAYAPGRQLVLEVRTTNTAPSALLAVDTPWLLPGGWLRLPLLDYHDSVAEMPETGTVVLAGTTSGTAPEDPRESPVSPWIGLAALAGAFLVRRRR